MSRIRNGLTCTIMLVIAVIFLSSFFKMTSLELHLDRQFEAPSKAHILGLGVNGVDLFSQLLLSLRHSLGIALMAAFCSSLLGIFLAVWAYVLRSVGDFILQNAISIFDSIPAILLSLCIASFIDIGVAGVVLAITLSSWPHFAKLTRLLILDFTKLEFVHSARALGLTRFQIFWRHLWPNLMPQLSVQLSLNVVFALSVESSMGFLGLGSPLGTPSLGSMISQGRESMSSAPHVLLFPVAALVLCVLSFQLMSDFLRDMLDVKNG